MPKLNLVLMVALALAVIGGAAFLSLQKADSQTSDRAETGKLLRKLADPDPDVRHEAEAGFREMGPRGLPALRDAAGSPDRVLAERAAKLLADLSPSEGPAVRGLSSD
jgi:hypothetical protein